MEESWKKVLFLLQKRNVGSILCNTYAHACRYTHRNNYLAWNLWLEKLILCRLSIMSNYWQAIRPLHHNRNLRVKLKKAGFAFETQIFTTTSFRVVIHYLVSCYNDFFFITFAFGLIDIIDFLTLYKLVLKYCTQVYAKTLHCTSTTFNPWKQFLAFMHWYLLHNILQSRSTMCHTETVPIWWYIHGT